MTDETPQIAALREALKAYGLANDVADDPPTLDKFVEACFEAIDNGPLEEWATCDEDLVYAQQAELIGTTYGKAAANKANYGWAVGGDDNFTVIGTKIYVSGRPILTSKINHETKEVIHVWE